jgi:hypothetical protein
VICKPLVATVRGERLGILGHRFRPKQLPQFSREGHARLEERHSREMLCAFIERAQQSASLMGNLLHKRVIIAVMLRSRRVLSANLYIPMI